MMREMLYGRQAVRESLRAGRRTFHQLFLAHKTAQTPIIDDLIGLAQDAHIHVTYIPRTELSARLGHDEHQGVALETSAYPYASIDEILTLAKTRQEPPLLILLDLIQDVHNLGSLVRTAEAVGVHGVIIPERRAAGVSPAAVNASSGAFEHLLVGSVTNLSQTIGTLKEAGLWIAGLEDIPGAQGYTAIDMCVPLAIVVGSEGSGLRRLVREQCDWLLAIPMRGRIGSLNAAVAGSIALYEAYNQRNAAT
ncbi:MAG: 23S rRNA (guanosine(2251)-2'-O)-methyltransferase RlmB [Anaerolineae bacterium]|nr:23S rRNA (guanosine(2251)-2'-O)-methyltransferase RlmB [Anaerolineae bacterium]